MFLFVSIMFEVQNVVIWLRFKTWKITIHITKNSYTILIHWGEN